MNSFWKRVCVIAWVCVGVLITSGANAQTVGTQNVLSDGMAVTYDQAVTQALQFAIAKVNGVDVSRKVITESVHGSSTNSTASQSVSERALTQHASGVAAVVDQSRNHSNTESRVAAFEGAQKLRTEEVNSSAKVVSQNFSAEKTTLSASAQTSGIVKRYQILESKKNADGWHVSVLAEVSAYNAAVENQRRKIVVLPFRLAKDNQSFRGFETSFRSGLINHLTQSSKLAVLDRDFSGEQNSELEFLKENGVKKEEAARLGNKLGADYIVVGAVDDVTTKTPVVTMHAIDRTVSGQTTTSIKVSFRVIEAATGRISLADTWVEPSSVGAKVEAVADHTANEVARSVIGALFPLRVEHVSNGVYYLGQGGKTIQVGQHYRLILMGKDIVDSYTKEVIGQEQEDYGVVEVFDVDAKLAKARLVASVDKSLPSNYGALVARLVEAKNLASDHSRAKATGQARSGLPSAKTLLKKNNDEW